jgi:predicted cupin superfamily sugar epimerase
MRTAEDWIRALNLRKHPEGGWFRETYRAAGRIPAAVLAGRFPGARPFATAIYFLLTARDRSVFHRLKSDEIWHFYADGSLTLHVLAPRGGYRRIRLGTSARGHVRGRATPQAVVPAGCWMAAEAAPRGFALVGCTVAPGFDFADFELGRRAALCRRFPRHRALIRRLTPSR